MNRFAFMSGIAALAAAVLAAFSAEAVVCTDGAPAPGGVLFGLQAGQLQ